jgi:hypothetical protein
LSPRPLKTTNVAKSYTLSTILKIKTLATEVGSLRELKALVEVMSD